MRQTSRHTTHVLVLAIMWAVIHILLFWHYGIRSLLDATGYVKWADFLIQHGAFQDTYHIFYAIPIGLIAFFRLLFPHEVLPFLIFQSVLSGIAMLAIYRSANRIFNSGWAGFLSAFLFLVWWDNIQWNTVTMTESLLCSFSCFLLYFIVHFEGQRRHYYLIFSLMFFIFFIRPTGIVLIVGTSAFLLHYHWSILSKRPLQKYTIILLCLLIACSGAMLMFSFWDFTDQYTRGNIVTYMDTLQGTKLYKGSMRMNTNDLIIPPADWSPMRRMFYFLVHNPVHFGEAAGRKVWYLLSGVRPYYSVAHNSYQIAWMAGIYFLSFHGWRAISAAPVKVFLISVIVVNCALIGISTVDWDNRFYVPMEPCIVLLAGGGGFVLINRIRNKIFPG